MTAIKKTPTTIWFMLILGVGSCLSSAAFAHKLNMFAYVENDRVFVEGYFSDGIKPKNSDVTVVAREGTILLEGKTDDQGAFSFTAPGQAPLRIVLNAGMGHQTEYTIAAVDLGGAVPAPGGSPESVSPGTSGTAGTAAPATRISAPEVEQTVRRAVAEAVKPLALEINALKNKTRLSDIIGGIGLIIGLLGGFAFYKATQAKKKEK